MELNRSDTAQKLNVSLTTLDDWRRKGCPHAKNGKQVSFNMDALKVWLDNRSKGDLDYTQERAKLTRLQAEKVTLELEQQRGNLLPLEMVIEGWQGQIANARARLLALPPKVAAQAVGADYVEIEQLFKSVIYEALDELAGDGVPEEYQKRLEVMAANLECVAPKLYRL
jgi:phage terminase Nu1 subunit (DNA packaging protein)